MSVIGHSYNKETKKCECGWQTDSRSILHWEEQWARHLASVRNEGTINRIERLEQLTYGLTEIPANEQCIGHLQAALQEFMQLTVLELKALRKET